MWLLVNDAVIKHVCLRLAFVPLRVVHWMEEIYGSLRAKVKAIGAAGCIPCSWWHIFLPVPDNATQAVGAYVDACVVTTRTAERAI
jgi:hypothetical protein